MAFRHLHHIELEPGTLAPRPILGDIAETERLVAEGARVASRGRLRVAASAGFAAAAWCRWCRNSSPGIH